ncbi:helix-turn-helix domain-containing protein [Prevotella sp. P6B1]|uniref:helix-turn-helix domain-containing protein n=1 Tax=Prevotella sp. P6B1 TaxID=1410613 RepID=UPI00051BC5FF|nr:helix-turn-helix domain-containing protein [Prevotella sp. P6B1]
MMRNIKYIYIIGVVTLLTMLVACGSKRTEKQGRIPENIIRTHGDSIALAARFSGDFKHFLAVTDSLAAIGELSPIRAEGYRGVAYFQMGQMDKCIECFRRVVAIENPPAEDFWEYIHAGTNLVIMLTTDRDYDNAMRTALRLIDKLKSVDGSNRPSELQTLYLSLGDTQMMLERHDEAAKSYAEAYKWVLQTPNDSTNRGIAASIQTLENIAVTHLHHKLDEAGVWVDRMDSLVTLYEKQPKPIEKEVKTLRALVLLHRAEVCQMRGQIADAYHNYAAYSSTDFGQSIEGRINGCDYLVAARRYSEAADNYMHLDQFIRDWGYEYDLETIANNLLPKLRANYHAGRRDSALRVAMQISEVYDSALVHQKRSESAELATIYDTQGKERQIAEQRAQNRIVTTISMAVTTASLLILALGLYAFLQWRITKRRNRILARQITEAVEYKEKYRALKQAQQESKEQEVELSDPPAQNSRIADPAEQAETTTIGAGLSISDFTTLTDEQLFLCLRDLIENEKLFLQPEFGRQSLIDRTGLSKERIGTAFSQGSDSVSLPAYIRELRLDYAVSLMNSQPELNVEQVSQASGFTSADTFTRNFRAKYGMTPTTYKQTNYNP